MSTSNPVLSVTGIRKAFDGRLVLEDLSFAVLAGEILGLIGANGGGKTTTLRMIAGLINPDTGSGSFLGKPLFPAPDRRNIGYMTQRNALYPDLSVAENLDFRAAVQNVDCARIAEAVACYGIADVMGQRVSALSGGWARRVEFVATVLHKPQLLLLDEPTAGLDVVTRRAMWQWMTSLADDGCTVIVSTHDLVEAEHCTNILLYHQGKVDGPTVPVAVLAAHGSKTLEDAVFAMASA
jgi:ABC-2 type transport system ATP-binding protein